MKCDGLPVSCLLILWKLELITLIPCAPAPATAPDAFLEAYLSRPAEELHHGHHGFHPLFLVHCDTWDPVDCDVHDVPAFWCQISTMSLVFWCFFAQWSKRWVLDPLDSVNHWRVFRWSPPHFRNGKCLRISAGHPLVNFTLLSKNCVVFQFATSSLTRGVPVTFNFHPAGGSPPDVFGPEKPRHLGLSYWPPANVDAAHISPDGHRGSLLKVTWPWKMFPQ